jgi:peptidyl-prolyl cis-trans isomerase D
MLAALRSNTKIILWIVVVGFVGFIFAGWGRGLQRSGTTAAPERGTIGRVDGVPITFRDFNEVVRQRLVEYAQQTGTDISEATREAVREETWNTMVADILISQEIERLGIDVPDELVFELLWNNPPSSVYNAPAFHDESGNFSFDLYHREIQLNPERWEGVAEMYRDSMKRQLLQNEVQAAALISENEVWDEFVAQNEKVRAKYVAVEPRRMDREPLEPTDEEVRNYFDTHRADYERPPTAVLHLVKFEKVASPEDEEDIVMSLAELTSAVRDGEDFAELAKVYSDGPSAPEGGDLGWFGRGKMVAAFEEVAFELEVGEVSEPVKTQFGYHIIKVEEKRGSGDSAEVKARHILSEIVPSEETLVGIEQDLQAFTEQVNEVGIMEAAAVDTAYVVETTTPFADGNFIPMVGSLRPAVKVTFESEPGTVVGPYVTRDAYYIFEVAERIPTSLPTYDELLTEAEEMGRDHPAKLALIGERQRDRARAVAGEIAAAVAAGATLEEAAEERGYEVRETTVFSRRDYVAGVGRGNEFVGVAFGLRTGETSGAVGTEAPERFYVLRVEEKVAADQAAFADAEEQIRGQLLQRERVELFTGWLEGLMARANIEDFRDTYF